MNSGSSSTRTSRRRRSKSPIRRSLEARSRGARFKLEDLETRTLLANSPIFGPVYVPVGLGLNYTAMAEQAYGVGQQNTLPGQYLPGSTTSTSTVTPAALQTYLKNLGIKYDTGPSSGAPTALSGAQSTGNSAPNSTLPTSAGGGSNNLDGGPADQGGFNAPPNLDDPSRQFVGIKNNPQSTGLSEPPLDPVVLSGFDGMNFLDSVNGYVPPDTDMAVGPQFVVATVNAQIQFYDKATGAALLPNTPLNEFFGQPGESPFDPVVTYDDIAGRFIVAADSFSGDLLLAVSNDSNPLDGFNSYDLNITEGGAFSPDYTKIGWNADEVVDHL